MLLNFLVIFLLTIAVLWFALKDNYKEILDAISQMNWMSLVIILLWGVLYTVVWGFVYLVLGRKYNKQYSLFNGIVISFVGTFFSGITPSSTGGQFAQAYIMKKQGIKVSDGASLFRDRRQPPAVPVLRRDHRHAAEFLPSPAYSGYWYMTTHIAA